MEPSGRKACGLMVCGLIDGMENAHRLNAHPGWTIIGK